MRRRHLNSQCAVGCLIVSRVVLAVLVGGRLGACGTRYHLLVAIGLDQFEKAGLVTARGPIALRL